MKGMGKLAAAGSQARVKKCLGYVKRDYILQLSTGSLTLVCVLQSLRTTTQVPNMVVS